MIASATDLEQMLSDVLDKVLAIFSCDRAWLIFPCDPNAGEWRVVMERTRPEYLGALATEATLESSEDSARVVRAVLAADEPVAFHVDGEPAVPRIAAEGFGVKSQLTMAVRPMGTQPYLFGIHACAAPRAWSSDERRLFQEIGRRLGDALTSLAAQRGLEESELRYRELLENSADAISLYEVTERGSFRLIDCNPAWERAVGVRHSDVRGSAIESFLPDERARDAIAAFQACVASGRRADVERADATSAGDRHLHTTLVPVRNEAGRVYRLLAIGRDVTEWKRAEAALRWSESRLAEAERIAHVGYWDRDFAEGVIHWSDETYRVFGVPVRHHTLSVEEYQRLIHPEDRARVRQAVKDAVFAGRRYDVEYRVVRPDGELRYVHSQGDVTRDDARGVLRMFGTVQDVTERRRAEDALRVSHSLLNAVIEGTTDLVSVKDDDGAYLMVNSACARFFGRTAEAVVGRHDRDLANAEEARARVETDRQVLASERNLTFEETVLSAGAPRTYLTSKSVYRDARGRVRGSIAISRDITERKRLEEQLGQAQKMEAVGRLAGGVAHVFNNLLTVINGYSELIAARVDTDGAALELIREVQKAGERAANLTGQLLAFSRKQLLQPRRVRLAALLDDLSKLLRSLLGEAIELSVRAAPELGCVKIDPGQFEQAVINLVVNARDAMPRGGAVRIESCNVVIDEARAAAHADAVPGRFARVTVTDTGEGIEPVALARIFEPFFTTKGPGRGTGLGLAMVYGFVRQSGGFVEVESAPGRGAAFALHLPLTDERGDEEADAREPRLVPSGHETVLLVEDEDAVRTLTRRILESCGYSVLEAGDGDEALRVARRAQRPIDLLLTDVVMPRFDGRHLADAITKLAPDVRVLLMSGYAGDAVPAGLDAGAGLAFLSKPFDAARLAHKVREVLDARPAHGADDR